MTDNLFSSNLNEGRLLEPICWYTLFFISIRVNWVEAQYA